MGFLSDLTDNVIKIGQAGADIHAQVKTTDAVSTDGLARIGVRPETIADQTSIGVPSPAGFNGAGTGKTVGIVNVAGLELSQPVIVTTGLLLFGMFAIRKLA